MIINDLLMQNNISDSQADELNDIMKNRDIIEVLIVEADDENEILKCEFNDFYDFEFVLPYSQYLRTLDVQRDVKLISNKIIGTSTYVHIDTIEEQFVVLNRTSALEVKENKFMQKFKVGDSILCTYENIIFKKNIEGSKYDELGMYLDCEGMKGILHKNNIPNIKSKKLSQLGIVNGDQIEGTITHIIPQKRIFILTMSKCEELELEKIYVGKYIKSTVTSHIFNVNEQKVFISRKKTKREFAKNQPVKLFVYDKNDNTGTTLYFAKLSN